MIIRRDYNKIYELDLYYTTILLSNKNLKSFVWYNLNN